MENKQIITQVTGVVEPTSQLPAEVAQIAQNVSTEKKAEVQKVLNHVFGGIAKMRETIDNITVIDENDKRAMEIAKQARLSVRDTRLDAVRDLDAKRTEVQKEMLSYKTEDALWLKTRQIVEILTKELEAEARWKEETKNRFDAEQKELKTQQRIDKVAKVAPEMSRSEFENMSEETFEIFLSGITKAYNDKIEAERIATEERLKAEQLERERIEAQRLENERLKKEAEEKEAQLKAERAEAEAKQKAVEEKARIEREAQEKKLQAERAEAKRLQDLKDAENAKLQAELQAKKDVELKAQQEAEREEKERQQAEAKAKKAPLKTKMNIWVDSFALPEFEENAISNDIKAKFEAFKKWSKSEIEKL